MFLLPEPSQRTLFVVLEPKTAKGKHYRKDADGDEQTHGCNVEVEAESIEKRVTPIIHQYHEKNDDAYVN